MYSIIKFSEMEDGIRELSAGLCRARNTSQRSNEVPSYPRSSKAWVCTNPGPRSPPSEEPQEAGSLMEEALIEELKLLGWHEL